MTKRLIDLQRYVDKYKRIFNDKCEYFLRHNPQYSQEKLDDIIESIIIHELEYFFEDDMIDYDLENFKDCFKF